MFLAHQALFSAAMPAKKDDEQQPLCRRYLCIIVIEKLVVLEVNALKVEPNLSLVSSSVNI